MFEIHTKRLILRDILETDFAILHQMRSNGTVTRYIEYIKSETEPETWAWIKGTMYHNSLSPRQSYNLAVVLQSTKEVIGWIGIGQAAEQEYGELDFGYALLPRYWGQGHATEALSALISFAFEKFDEVNSIHGECDVNNFASARVMEKAGLRRSNPEATGDPLYVISRAEWKISA